MTTIEALIVKRTEAASGDIEFKGLRTGVPDGDAAILPDLMAAPLGTDAT